VSRLLRLISGMLAGVAAACVAVGWMSSGTAVAVQAGSEAVYSDAQTKTFGEAPSGAKIILTFRLTNASDRSLKILGSSPACFPGGCVRASDLPEKLAPKTSCGVIVEVATAKPGAFKGRLALFTDYPGSEVIHLNVEGMVTERNH
jgi:hypothetical protein